MRCAQVLLLGCIGLIHVSRNYFDRRISRDFLSFIGFTRGRREGGERGGELKSFSKFARLIGQFNDVRVVRY